MAIWFVCDGRLISSLIQSLPFSEKVLSDVAKAAAWIKISGGKFCLAFTTHFSFLSFLLFFPLYLLLSLLPSLLPCSHPLSFFLLVIYLKLTGRTNEEKIWLLSSDCWGGGRRLNLSLCFSPFCPPPTQKRSKCRITILGSPRMQ